MHRSSQAGRVQFRQFVGLKAHFLRGNKIHFHFYSEQLYFFLSCTKHTTKNAQKQLCPRNEHTHFIALYRRRPRRLCSSRVGIFKQKNHFLQENVFILLLAIFCYRRDTPLRTASPPCRRPWGRRSSRSPRRRRTRGRSSWFFPQKNPLIFLILGSFLPLAPRTGAVCMTRN